MLPFDYRSGQAMTTNDDMREQLQRVETKVDGLAKRIDILETKVDALPTKADLTGFATKADLTGFATKADLIEFKDEIIKNVRILTEEAKASAQKAAEGYGATLKRIERKLGERNNRVRTRLSDHDKVLANHNDRLVALEPPLRR